MHLDNARRHNSKKSNECLAEFRARRVPHPAYSPDLAPSDFFLFGTVETELQNYEIHSREDLILAIRAIFDQISKEILISVYVS
jgi:histone-lysine N-methyltransferase SETMAR